jgi:hypothetical protein
MTIRPTLGPKPDGPKTQVDLRTSLARRCLQLAFVLFVIGLVAGFLALWGQRRTAAAAVWHNPADNIQVALVAPDLALLSLAGVPDDQALALAMEQGELATTHALLALSLDLNDAQRMNGWLWLAYRYRRAEQTQRAAQAYRLAGGGAVLSPDLPDLLRTETLLAVGQGLIDMHDKASARLYLKQAALIGAYSPHLTAYHRHMLLERIVPTSLRAEGKRDDWSALAQAVKSGTAKGGNFAVSGPAGGTDWRSFPAESDAALVQARDARRAAAAEWLQAMTASNGAPGRPSPNDTDPEEKLRTALLTEGAAVYRFAEQDERTSTSGPAAQQTRLRWLSLKRWVAAGGFGAGLMPEWESKHEAIDSALTTAWSDWLTFQVDPVGAGLSDDVQVRQAIMAAYWGLYPDAPIADLVSAAQYSRGFGGLHLTILEPGTPPVLGWSE